MRRQPRERVRHFKQRAAAEAFFKQARMPTVGDDNQARSSNVHGRSLSCCGMSGEPGRFPRTLP